MTTMMTHIRPNSPDLNPVNYKILASSLPEEEEDVNDFRRHV